MADGDDVGENVGMTVRLCDTELEGDGVGAGVIVFDVDGDAEVDSVAARVLERSRVADSDTDTETDDDVVRECVLEAVCSFEKLGVADTLSECDLLALLLVEADRDPVTLSVGRRLRDGVRRCDAVATYDGVSVELAVIDPLAVRSFENECVAEVDFDAVTDTLTVELTLINRVELADDDPLPDTEVDTVIDCG